MEHLGVHKNSLKSVRAFQIRSNWNLKMWVFKEWGKPEYPRKKTSRSKDENQRRPQLACGADARI